ncbi:unnamed protein product, partial [Discosporangium mesarthrocarpum]
SNQPTFVPKKGKGGLSLREGEAEDEGYLMTTLVNGRDQRTEVILLDASNLARGPVCRMALKGFVPHQLHG